jgi:hypothetical protein
MSSDGRVTVTKGEVMTDTTTTLFERGRRQGYQDAGKDIGWETMLCSQVYVATNLPTLLEDPHDEMSAGYVVGIIQRLRERREG